MAKQPVKITNLSDNDVLTIVEIIDAWPRADKLTWEALVKRIRAALRKTWTRQALSRHVRIAEAYKLRKKSLRGAVPYGPDDEDVPEELKVALAYIDRLENETRRLKHENSQLLEQFEIWAYNAEAQGLIHVLHRPLPRVDKQSTRDEYKPRRSSDRPRKKEVHRT